MASLCFFLIFLNAVHLYLYFSCVRVEEKVRVFRCLNQTEWRVYASLIWSKHALHEYTATMFSALLVYLCSSVSKAYPVHAYPYLEEVIDDAFVVVDKK